MSFIVDMNIIFGRINVPGCAVICKSVPVKEVWYRMVHTHNYRSYMIRKSVPF